MSLLESENIQLNEKCDRYLCALNQANKENIKLNRDLRQHRTKILQNSGKSGIIKI